MDVLKLEKMLDFRIVRNKFGIILEDILEQV